MDARQNCMVLTGWLIDGIPDFADMHVLNNTTPKPGQKFFVAHLNFDPGDQTKFFGTMRDDDGVSEVTGIWDKQQITLVKQISEEEGVTITFKPGKKLENWHVPVWVGAFKGDRTTGMAQCIANWVTGGYLHPDTDTVEMARQLLAA